MYSPAVLAVPLTCPSRSPYYWCWRFLRQSLSLSLAIVWCSGFNIVPDIYPKFIKTGFLEVWSWQSANIADIFLNSIFWLLWWFMMCLWLSGWVSNFPVVFFLSHHGYYAEYFPFLPVLKNYFKDIYHWG